MSETHLSTEKQKCLGDTAGCRDGLRGGNAMAVVLVGVALRRRGRLSPADQPGSSRGAASRPVGGACRDRGLSVGRARGRENPSANHSGPAGVLACLGLVPGLPEGRAFEFDTGKKRGATPRGGHVDVGTRLQLTGCPARARVIPGATSTCKRRPVPPGQWEGAQDWWCRIRLWSKWWRARLGASWFAGPSRGFRPARRSRWHRPRAGPRGPAGWPGA